MTQSHGAVETEFKETEIGLIPADWDISTIGVETEVKTSTSSTKRAQKWASEDGDGVLLLLLKVSDLNLPGNQTHIFTSQNVFRIKPNALDELSTVPPQSVIFPKRGGAIGTNKKRITLEYSLLDPNLIAVIPSSRINLGYLFNWFLLFDLATVTDDTTIPQLNKKDVEGIKLPLPPLPEQRRIAAVLNAIQEDIAAQEDVIAEAREFKRSLMQRLFTYGPGAQPAVTRNTEIGEIPAHWEVVELGQLTAEKIMNGAFVKRDQFGQGTPFLNVADIYKATVPNLSSVERVTVAPEDLKHYALVPGDLIFVRSSLKEEGVGQCCVIGAVEEPSIFDCHLMRVRVKEREAIPRFIAYYFLSEPGKRALIVRSKKTTMTTINQAGLSSALAPKPPIDEQSEIADMIAAAEEKIAAEEDRKAGLQDLFKATLHQLMTGQVRLLSDEGMPL